MATGYAIVNLSKGIVQNAAVGERTDGYVQIDLEVGPKPPKVRAAYAGWAWARGQWISSGKSRSYNVRTEIVGAPVELQPPIWSFVVPQAPAGGGFTYTDEGVLRAPGGKVDLPWKSDLWFALLQSGPVQLAPMAREMTVSHKAGEARVEVAATLDGFEWRVDFARKARARGVRLELVRRCHPKVGWEESRELIAAIPEPCTQEGQWRSPVALPPTLFLSRTDLRPPDLKPNLPVAFVEKQGWVLGDPIPSAGSFQSLRKGGGPLAWGAYRLEIILDRPLAPDKRAAIDLSPAAAAAAPGAPPAGPAPATPFRVLS